MTDETAFTRETLAEYIDRLYGTADKLRSQNFAPNDSVLASTINHPIEGIKRGVDWFRKNVNTAAGIADPYDNPNTFAGYTPEQQSEAALNLVGLVGTSAMPLNRAGGPGTAGMFAGLNSATADKNKAYEAAKMLRSGANKETALESTGWFQGPEQAWRYEINDAQAKLRYPMEDIAESELFKQAKLYNLGDILDHPELFKAYPELAETGFLKRVGFMDLGGLQGWRDPKMNQIGVTPYAEDPLGTILHEVQHYIQEKEGFGLGGNANSVLQSVPKHEVEALTTKALDTVGLQANETEYLINGIQQYKDHPIVQDLATTRAADRHYWDIYWKNKESDPEKSAEAYKMYRENLVKLNDLKDAMSQSLFGTKSVKLGRKERDLLDQLENPEKNLKDLTTKYTKLQQDMTGLQTGDLDVLKKYTNTHNLYKRLAGETEARNVPLRQNMSDVERRSKPAWETQEYPYSEQIISRDK